jgi:hypothetical protein
MTANNIETGEKVETSLTNERTEIIKVAKK